MGITLSAEQFKQKYGQSVASSFDRGITLSADEFENQYKPSFSKDLKTISEKRGQQFLDAADRKQGIASKGLQATGAILGGASDVLRAGVGAAYRAVGEPFKKESEAVIQKAMSIPLLDGITLGESITGISKDLERLAIEKPELAANISAVLSIGDFALSAAGVGQGLKTTQGAVRKTIDTAENVTERIKSLRQTLPTPNIPIVTPIVKKVTHPIETVKSFADNPSVTGAVDDIKIMAGLPGKSPAVDLTFRSIKPRLKKGMNLRRIKEQMTLANQVISENGFKPTTVREYANAIFDSKKKVWGEIETKLQAGAAEGRQVDLGVIANKILDRAEDSALLRTNPKAAAELTRMAEDLTKQGNKIGILEAERMKQLLNSELDGDFGNIDFSKHAKEAKKLLTSEIGVQLNKHLSELPDDFRDLKIKYGALSAIEEDALKRAIVFERQNPEGLADILTKTEAAAELAFGNTKSRLRAVARLTMGQRLKKANSADELIKRAFEILLQ